VSSSQPPIEQLLPERAPAEPEGIARAASIIALGNVASRVLGLVREMVIAHFFGATGTVSAFRLAARVPTMLYDLLIGGMLSAALVPVFSELAARESRAALWRLFSQVLSLVAVLLAAIVLLLELLAPQVALLLGGGFDAELLDLLTRLIRIIGPAVILFGLSGAITGLLYSLRRFALPALGAAVFNLGIIICAPLLADQLDVRSLAVGVLVGSGLQLAIQLPDLRDVRVRFDLSLSHPALRQIGRLYLPIALGLVISQIQIAIDGNLASRTGESSVAWMQNATTLIQFPHGLVAVAISLAVLPSLSRLSALKDIDGFRETLGRGLRLVLVLIIPATLGLLALADPLVGLIFERGRFTAYDTYWTAWALRLYLAGLIFASVDWPLNYAFYARQDTLTPALVGVWSVAVYLVVALSLIGPLGMLGLVLADSAKHIGHAAAMFVLAWRRIGSLRGLGLARVTFKAGLAAGTMVGLVAAMSWGLHQVLDGDTFLGRLVVVGLAGGLGLGAYVGLVSRLNVQEVALLRDTLWRRLRRGLPDTDR
jgi:putative peptidoglycan lipid II flippase